ncbi:metal ABC transporter substrate-binding protein [Thermoflexus sp.]|uniref:metal ABC transporter substrate-binding protein n=1 Tax=Thermoflexus sp. TaxID=1969742 RepID=UPI0035E41F60
MPRFPCLPSSGRIVVALTILLTACGAPAAAPIPTPRPLTVAATTPIVGDVVRQIGGEHVRVTVLLPLGADPHAFEPSPQDIARVADADVVFAVGAGLEVFLEPLLRSAGGKALRVELTEGIPLRPFEAEVHSEGQSAVGTELHAHGAWDPHVWLDPNNVITWTHTIEAVLSRVDPARADRYRRNAEAYRAQLRELDAWIREQVSQIPPERRKLVTDHQVFGYFAHRYGFEQVGVILPGGSTVAQPSAREIAALEETLRALGVPAIFVSSTVDPALARRIAQDTGARLVQLYVDSLSPPGGEADSYIQMMRYNVRRIVEALR